MTMMSKPWFYVLPGCVRTPCGHHLRQDVREPGLRSEHDQLEQGDEVGQRAAIQCQLQLLTSGLLLSLNYLSLLCFFVRSGRLDDVINDRDLDCQGLRRRFRDQIC